MHPVVILKQRRIKQVESYLPAGNVFGGIWRSFSGAAYWMACNSCLGVASPLAKPASTQSQCNDVLQSRAGVH